MLKTDKELFRDYLLSKDADNFDTVGTLYLTGHEFYDLDGVLRDMANAIIVGEPQPVEELDDAIQTFRSLASSLERLKAGFIAYRAAQEAA